MDEALEPEYTFDFSKMETSSEIASMHQEGNFLIGRTDKGVTFRHFIPQGKMLNKNEKGEWIIQSIEVK